MSDFAIPHFVIGVRNHKELEATESWLLHISAVKACVIILEEHLSFYSAIQTALSEEMISKHATLVRKSMENMFMVSQNGRGKQCFLKVTQIKLDLSQQCGASVLYGMMVYGSW